MKYTQIFVMLLMFIITSFVNAIDEKHMDCELSIQQIIENNVNW